MFWVGGLSCFFAVVFIAVVFSLRSLLGYFEVVLVCWFSVLRVCLAWFYCELWV